MLVSLEAIPRWQGDSGVSVLPIAGSQEPHLVISLGKDSCGCGMLGSRAVRTPGRLTAWAPPSVRLVLPATGASTAVCFAPEVLGCGYFSGLLDLSHGQTWVVGSSLLLPRRSPLATPGNP